MENTASVRRGSGETSPLLRSAPKPPGYFQCLFHKPGRCHASPKSPGNTDLLTKARVEQPRVWHNKFNKKVHFLGAAVRKVKRWTQRYFVTAQEVRGASNPTHTAQSRRHIFTKRSPLGRGTQQGSWSQPSPLCRVVAPPRLEPQSGCCSHGLLLRHTEMHNISLSLATAAEDPGCTGISSLTPPQKTFTTSPPNAQPPWPPCSQRDTHLVTPRCPGALSTISCHHQSSSNSCPRTTALG